MLFQLHKFEQSKKNLFEIRRDKRKQLILLWNFKQAVKIKLFSAARIFAEWTIEVEMLFLVLGGGGGWWWGARLLFISFNSNVLRLKNHFKTNFDDIFGTSDNVISVNMTDFPSYKHALEGPPRLWRQQPHQYHWKY